MISAFVSPFKLIAMALDTKQVNNRSHHVLVIGYEKVRVSLILSGLPKKYPSFEKLCELDFGTMEASDERNSARVSLRVYRRSGSSFATRGID